MRHYNETKTNESSLTNGHNKFSAGKTPRMNCANSKKFQLQGKQSAALVSGSAAFKCLQLN